MIIDGRLKVSPDALVFRQTSTAPSILVTSAANLARAQRRFRGSSVEVIGAQAERGVIALDALMRQFGQRGWCRVLIEGGAHLAGAALAAGIVDRVAMFIAPRILGSGLSAVEGLTAASVKHSLKLEHMTVRASGADWLIEADVAHSPQTDWN